MLKEPPLLHAGGSTVYGLDEAVIRFLSEALPDSAKTLETGLGLSTVVFALRSQEHTAITPSQDQVLAFRAYCDAKGISHTHVTSITDFSQQVLPTLDRANLDLILIDGGHGFPIPAIDWFYTAPMLKIGGLLIIDDTHIWTGQELKRFLNDESDWEQIATFPRSVVFRKTGPKHANEWSRQPYVVRMSRLPRLIDKLSTARSLLRSGQYSVLIGKLRSAIFGH